MKRNKLVCFTLYSYHYYNASFKSGIHEKQVPIAYDDGYDQDEELGRKIPRRSLTNFKFKFASSGDKAPLESINHTPLLGEGTVVYSGKEDVVVHFVATEWSIEYGIIIQLQDTPQLWVKSRNCWYKLLEASDEYKGLYQPTLQKASLCTALVDILDSLSSDSESETEGDKSGDYNSVVAALLSRNKLFTEQFLLDNRDFVVKQLKSADLPENDFIGELKKKAKRPLSPKGLYLFPTTNTLTLFQVLRMDRSRAKQQVAPLPKYVPCYSCDF